MTRSLNFVLHRAPASVICKFTLSPSIKLMYNNYYTQRGKKNQQVKYTLWKKQNWQRAESGKLCKSAASFVPFLPHLLATKWFVGSWLPGPPPIHSVGAGSIGLSVFSVLGEKPIWLLGFWQSQEFLPKKKKSSPWNFNIQMGVTLISQNKSFSVSTVTRYCLFNISHSNVAVDICHK